MYVSELKALPEIGGNTNDQKRECGLFLTFDMNLSSSKMKHNSEV